MTTGCTNSGIHICEIIYEEFSFIPVCSCNFFPAIGGTTNITAMDIKSRVYQDINEFIGTFVGGLDPNILANAESFHKLNEVFAANSVVDFIIGCEDVRDIS